MKSLDKPLERLNYCSEILYHQIQAFLPKNYLEKVMKCKSAEDLINLLFDCKASYYMLVKASGGNARDLIDLFRVCVQQAFQNKTTISFRDVMESTKVWFAAEKYRNLHHNSDTKPRELFDKLVSFVVEEKNTRGFLVRPELYESSRLPELVDARVLHIIAKYEVVACKRNFRYHILTIDYGGFMSMADGCCTKRLFKNDRYEQICAECAGTAEARFYYDVEYHPFANNLLRALVISIENEELKEKYNPNKSAPHEDDNFSIYLDLLNS